MSSTVPKAATYLAAVVLEVRVVPEVTEALEVKEALPSFRAEETRHPETVTKTSGLVTMDASASRPLNDATDRKIAWMSLTKLAVEE